MFNGIVTDVGKISKVINNADRRFVISTAFNMDTVDIGASIACGGVCLTVVEKTPNSFSVDVSQESLRVTSLSDWAEGSEINLERSLKLGDELGGHIVTGHVDCVGQIAAFEAVGGSIKMDVSIPAEHRHLVAEKGSVCVDGASLTVNGVEDSDNECLFSINLIPHTQEVTSFRKSATGDKVNIEFDVLARYVARLQNQG